MRPAASAAFAALLALAGTEALGQVPLRPGVASTLTWRGEEQARGFRSMETIYRTATVRAGSNVRALPAAARQIAPTITLDGRSVSLDDYMRANRVSGVLAIKNGQIVLEKYGLGRTAKDRWVSFSVTKSITSTLVGAAIQDGKIASLDAPVSDSLPDLKGSAYEGVTVRQMLTMSSGVKWNEDYADPNSDVARSSLTRPEPGRNAIVSYLAKLPRERPAGAAFHYNTGETDLVGVMVSQATGKPLAEYLSEKIWRPFGMEQDGAWLVDPSGHERGGCCISMTLRDYGRFGLFMLENGVAGGRRVLPPGWVAEATSAQIRNGAPDPGYGYFWWLEPNGYAAKGIFGQGIYVYPADQLVVVFNSAWPAADEDSAWAAQSAVAAAIRAAAVR
ncbi:serine hydrolase domain-containing protein [Phenylobacterium sp.]|uniref:serine hydrolase domain-containing protein n=1 Tax=Phenylobacterium sp. TaxID=1871053 RepID=UPI0037850B6D